MSSIVLFQGSVEIVTKATTIDAPFFDVAIGPRRKIQIMSIDNLPCQFPKDSSSYFSGLLKGIVSEYIQNGASASGVPKLNLLHLSLGFSKGLKLQRHKGNSQEIFRICLPCYLRMRSKVKDTLDVFYCLEMALLRCP